MGNKMLVMILLRPSVTSLELLICAGSVILKREMHNYCALEFEHSFEASVIPLAQTLCQFLYSVARPRFQVER